MWCNFSLIDKQNDITLEWDSKTINARMKEIAKGDNYPPLTYVGRALPAAWGIPIAVMIAWGFLAAIEIAAWYIVISGIVITFVIIMALALWWRINRKESEE